MSFNIIHLEGTFNTRDIGGIINKYGKKIKSNLLIRSDALNTITSNDVEFFKNMNLKTIVDFRGNSEIKKAPDIEISGTKIIKLSPNAETAALASGNITDDQLKINILIKETSTSEGRNKLHSKMDEMVDQMRELVNQPYANSKYKEFLTLLLDKNNLPLLHHCRGGKDRTGFASMITLFALDVDIETVRKEYMTTKTCMAKRNEKRMNEYRRYTENQLVLDYLSGLMQTKEIYFDAAIDEMKKLSGSIEMYLEEYLELTREKKEKINQIFLEE